MNDWHCLASIPGQVAVLSAWKRLAPNQIEGLCAAALERTAVLASSVPCPLDCGCGHEIVAGPTGSFLGICRCESESCNDLILTTDDVVLWRLSPAKLGRRV